MSSAFHQIICMLVFLFYFFFLSEAIAKILKSPVSVVSVKAHAIAAGSLCSSVVPYTSGFHAIIRLTRSQRVQWLPKCTPNFSHKKGHRQTFVIIVFIKHRFCDLVIARINANSTNQHYLWQGGVYPTVLGNVDADVNMLVFYSMCISNPTGGGGVCLWDEVL